MTVEEAVAKLQAAGIAAMVYTSPSHKADSPRWRVLCPASAPLPAADRTRLVARLNGVLGGILAIESFRLSQAYYFGSVENNPDHVVELVEGRYIDLASELDKGAVRACAEAGTRIELPVFAAGSAPDEHAAAALDFALKQFSREDAGGRHQTLLAIARVLAPFIKAGLLDAESVMADVANAMAASGRDPNRGEVEDAFRWAIERAQPYEPWPDGSEFCALIAELPPAPRRSSLRDRFLFPADCATGPRRGYLIKHLLAPGDVAALIGPPGAGKSILAPHLAYALAQGRAVFNLRTKPGRILYLVAEDFSGMRQRIHALKLRYGNSDNFAVVDVENLRDPETVKDLRAAVAYWKPSLVVLDTLGATFAGMDENSPKDMGEVVKLARELAATGAAVLVIHHIAKHGDGSPRGHSVLNGTLDMCLSLASKGDDGVIHGKLTKNRNGTTDRDIAFRFEAVNLGQDEDGDSITAPRAIELDPRDNASAAKRPKLSPGEASALCLLHEMAADGESVPEDEWRARCDDGRAVSAAPKPDSRRRAFDRAYSKLLDAGLVMARSDHVFLTEDGQSTAINAVLNRAGQTSTSRNGSELSGRDQRERGAGKPGHNPDNRKRRIPEAGQARTKPGQSRFVRAQSQSWLGRTRTDPLDLSSRPPRMRRGWRLGISSRTTPLASDPPSAVRSCRDEWLQKMAVRCPAQRLDLHYRR